MSELTPQARVDAAKRRLADAISELIEAHLAKGVGEREWVDQFSSPLGKSRHLRLAKNGTLRGVREGQLVLVRRVEIDAYLEGHPPVRAASKTEASDNDQQELERMVRYLTEPTPEAEPKKRKATKRGGRRPVVPANVKPTDTERAAARAALRRAGFVEVKR